MHRMPERRPTSPRPPVGRAILGRDGGRLVKTLALLTILLAVAPFRVDAQTEPPDSVTYRFSPLVVTVTRTARPIAETPAPVSLLDRARIREQTPNTVADLFRGIPGLDVNGAGTNQARPVIRGQRGQRILLLEDGMRLNNSRRQQDFGELPALVDVSALQRVEVVRGPASVLYGTDAIGGVVNLITRTEPDEGINGIAAYRYGNVESQNKITGRASGRSGPFDFNLGGTWRRSDPYKAPAGSFGEITLADETVVQETGVKDKSFDARFGYRPSDDHHVFAKGELYRADEAGFGYVDPADYAPDEARIAINYPFQDFDKLTLGYGGQNLGSALVDRLDVVGYYQANKRQLDFDLFTAFTFPGAPPGAGLEVKTENVSDLTTVGFRVEGKKLASDGILITYGTDFFTDDSKNTDRSEATAFGFGPPMPEIDETPQLPSATYRSIGLFAQGELDVGERTTLIVGGRFQDIRAETKDTPGLDYAPTVDQNSAVVGAANAIVELAEGFSAVAAVGRAFRAPNLVELFFDGPTPEGSGFQRRNPDLGPETSLNVDLGLRFENRRVAAEAFVFRNEIKDGIRIIPTGDEVDEVPVSQNVNIDELLFRGVEVSADIVLGGGLSAGGSLTRLDTEDALNPDNPIGESYSSKITGTLRYREPEGRFWAKWEIRRNGKQKDVALVDNPLGGDFIPAFTVQSLRAGVIVLRRGGTEQRIALSVTNLTNELYAEFSNASFFRPEPKRNVTLTWELAF